MLSLRGQPAMEGQPSDALANGAEKLLQLIDAECESVRLTQRREMDLMQASNKEFQHNACLVATELKRKANSSAREAETWKEQAAKASQEAYAAQQELERLRGEIAAERWKAREILEGLEGSVMKIEEPQTPTIPPSLPSITEAADSQDELALWKSKCASLVTEKDELAAAHERVRLGLVKKNVVLSMAVRLLKDRCQTLQQKADEKGTGSENTNTHKRSAETESESSPDAAKRARTDDTA
ncbi:hypothetical protein BD410DRAFT_784951 [Rickenella mellea]|uniref:Uncharacterized protein n=1 Tax=Rickenella mellea TaxID=50990 RepID=A0A4Y7QDG5_9AGAM|nr:hypothetical protein BD410DRAFT_784951 [Rickenella mellea]